jgi:hypothetical protein
MMLACSVIACAPAKLENKGASPVKSDITGAPAKVEISVAPPVKAAIDKATPAAKYAYYVVKGAEPKVATDLTKRTLFICCVMPFDNIFPIVESAIPSLNAPLYAGVQAYVISLRPNESRIRSELSIEYLKHKGRKVPFKGKEIVFFKDVTEDEIQQRAIEDMRADANGVLLLSRGSKAPATDFVEIVFK